jgi:hypothetical protein
LHKASPVADVTKTSISGLTLKSKGFEPDNPSVGSNALGLITPFVKTSGDALSITILSLTDQGSVALEEVLNTVLPGQMALTHFWFMVLHVWLE